MPENSDKNQLLSSVAKEIRDAYDNNTAIEPIREKLSNSIDDAYEVQNINTDYWVEHNKKRIVGRKIGLTSLAVQQQLGVDAPDFGMLFSDMDCSDGLAIDISRVLQPKIEVEIGFVLNQDLDSDSLITSDILSAIDYAVPALEIVGSRVKNWDISIVDTVADNASSGLFVLGHQYRKLQEFDSRLCGMVMENHSEVVSVGAGAACLGGPINATLWLAKKMVDIGRPLKKGELVLSGALGPMVAVNKGDSFNAKINGLGTVNAVFT